VIRVSQIDTHELAGALAVMATGVFAFIEARSFEFGTLNRMGPGYFPTVTSAVMILLGILLALASLRGRTNRRRMWLLPLVAVISSLLAWVLLFPIAGFVPATAALFLISSLAQGRFRPGYIIGATILMSAFGLGVFSYGLNIPIDAFRF